MEDTNLTDFLISVREEVARSRRLFPGNRQMVAALGEEFGELCSALLSGDWQAVAVEATQVAACAARIACDGDGDLLPASASAPRDVAGPAGQI